MGYAPRPAVVRLRVTEVAAVQADSVGLVTSRNYNGAVCEIPCMLDDPVAVVAAGLCHHNYGREDGGVIVLDTVGYGWVFHDDSPFSSDPLGWDGKPRLWDFPSEVCTDLTPMPPVPGVPDRDGFVAGAAGWLGGFSPVDPARVGPLQRRWYEQRDRVCRCAARRAEEVRPLANGEEAGKLNGLLVELDYRARNWPDDEDMELDEQRQPVRPDRGVWLQRTASEIHKLADTIEQAAAERDRKQQAIADATRLGTELFDRLPEEAQLAVTAGMVPDCLGMMRSTLLKLLRPGWEFTDDTFKPAANPPAEALRTLLTTKEQFPGVRLMFRPGEKKSRGELVLTDEFLGRTVVSTVA